MGILKDNEVDNEVTDECPDTLGMKLFSLTHDE